MSNFSKGVLFFIAIMAAHISTGAFAQTTEKTYALKSSNPNAVTGWSTDAAIERSFTLRVQRLAKQEVWSSTFTGLDNKVTTEAGTFDIEIRKVKFSLNVDTELTLRQLVDKINSEVAGVTAFAYDTNDGSSRPVRIMLTDKILGKGNNSPGAGKDFNFVLQSTLTDLPTIGFHIVVEGVNSAIFMNNEMVYRSDNTISDVVPGVTLRLRGEDPTHNVTITVDHDAASACGGT
jgi:flagellar hook-associated protein 2